MVPVPVSAFAMYQNMMNAKKKSKKKNKNKKKNADPVKVTPMIAAELIKVAAGKSVKPKASEAIVPSTEESVNRNLPQVEIAEATAFADRRPMDEVDNGLAELVMFKKSKERKKNKTSSKKLLVNSTSSELKKKISPHASNSEVLPLSSLESSEETAGKIFEWLMDPITKEDFLKLYWERRPVHISRTGNRDYYSDVLSTSAIDSMLRKHNILYGKNLDITSYTNGERETFNTVGRAHAAVVWDYYRNGCSVRLLNPQTYHIRLLELNSRLQEVFGSFVGANAYLTPPNSQGFAPHYDDIEAFVLQIEGSKKWRVYAPRAPEEKLPRTSSPNFSQSEIGDPVLEVHLKAGDLLYFPRGFIHQAATVPGDHSLHVTISTYQRNSWADFMEKIVPAALANAIQEDEEFRRGMPLHAMKHIGAVHSESDSREREAIMKKVRKLFEKLLDFAPVDAAADQMAKDFIHDALPPLLTSAEKKCSVLENSERMVHNGKLQGQIEVNIETPIRLTRSNILRLVSEEEEDTIKIYHSMENSLEYHGEEIQSIEIPLNLADAVEHLIFSYPNFVKIAELPLDSEADKIRIATELWERGLILTDKPLFTGTVQDD